MVFLYCRKIGRKTNKAYYENLIVLLYPEGDVQNGTRKEVAERNLK